MKMLTATRISNGKAVWLAADHSWVDSAEAAEIARDEATREKLERAGRAALLKKEVAELRLVDVTVAEEHVRPLRQWPHPALHQPQARQHAVPLPAGG